jgi:hypothetical protein
MPKREYNAISRKALLNQLIDQIETSIELMDTSEAKPDDADAIYAEFTGLLEKLEDELCSLTEDPEFS